MINVRYNYMYTCFIIIGLGVRMKFSGSQVAYIYHLNAHFETIRTMSKQELDFQARLMKCL